MVAVFYEGEGEVLAGDEVDEALGVGPRDRLVLHALQDAHGAGERDGLVHDLPVFAIFKQGLGERQWLIILRGLVVDTCLLYTSPSPRDQRGSRMPSSA